ncbi:uncharacterized protein PAC_17181 [Phialocephala subalpina]|uniref:Uncharacterized protein n=1 Tax=Phialocephala subalpina TaxID=576137 RepID=A0A1L7XQF4_9HELO|nr:uncharacterized protein PAC_17181 [Phialocephala subalpina]
MASVQNPTYMLAPNWTFRPSGPIALENIVVDPFKPHRRLHLGKSRNLSLSLWAQFLQNIGVNVGTDHDSSTSTDYTMKSLETVYFIDEPSIEVVNEIVKDPKVHKLMRLEKTLSRPVYMVTGIKIAKGFELSVERSSRHGGNVEASAPVVAQVSVGAGIGGSVETSRSDGFQSTSDIVFAHQLLKVVPKGWGEKSFKVKEYQSKATFLDDGVADEDVAIEVEWSFATGADLAEAGKGRLVTETKVIDGKEEYVCVSFKEK